MLMRVDGDTVKHSWFNYQRLTHMINNEKHVDGGWLEGGGREALDKVASVGKACRAHYLKDTAPNRLWSETVPAPWKKSHLMCDQRRCLQVFSFLLWNSQSRLCSLPTTTSVSLSTRLPEEVSHNFGSDRMSTHVGCGAPKSQLVNCKRKHGCTSITDQQMAGEPRLCSCVSVHVDGVQGTAGGLCQQILAPFSSILLLSARMHDLLHLYRIIAGKWLKPNTGTTGPQHNHHAPLPPQILYLCTCKHEQKASPDSSWGSWVPM